MSNPSLEKLGELLMRRVRDKAIGDWEGIVTGEMRGTTGARVRQQLTAFGPQQTNVLLKLLPQIVDTTLHHLLWTLEQEQSVNLLAKDEHDVFYNAREASDGLAGELYGDQGWIARFSSKPKHDF